MSGKKATQGKETRKEVVLKLSDIDPRFNVCMQVIPWQRNKKN